MLDPTDRDAIASLVGNRPYQLLLSEVEASIQDILGAMSLAVTNEELLFHGRLWQALFRILNYLKTTPEQFKQEIEEEIKNQPWQAYASALPPERMKLLMAIEQTAKNTNDFSQG